MTTRRRGHVAISAMMLLAALSLALDGCDDPYKRVAVGNREYRSLPAGDAVSWPSSGTSNGAGCVPPSGNPQPC